MASFLPSLANALLPDAWLQARDTPAASQSGSSLGGLQAATSGRVDNQAKLNDGRPSASDTVDASLTDLAGPARGIYKMPSAASEATADADHEPPDASIRASPSALGQSEIARDGMSRVRSSSLQSWQLSPPPAHEALLGPSSASPAPAAEASQADPHGLAMMSSTQPASEPVALQPPVRAGMLPAGEVSVAAAAAVASSDAGNQGSAVPSLQRSISLQANAAQDAEKLWSTPMFPSLESRTHSQTERARIPDSGATAISPEFTDDQPSENALVARRSGLQKVGADSAPPTPAGKEERASSSDAQAAGKRARRVSFASYTQDALPLTDAAGPEALKHEEQVLKTSTLLLSSFADGQPEQRSASVSEVGDAAHAPGHGVPADEFDVLVAGKEPRRSSLKPNDLVRPGTLEHVSSLAWRRAFLDDLDDPAGSDPQLVERRPSLQQMQQSFTRRGSRYQADDAQATEAAAMQVSMSSRAGSHTSSNGQTQHRHPFSQDISIDDHISIEGLRTRLGTEDDWQSLVVERQPRQAMQSHLGLPAASLAGSPLEQAAAAWRTDTRSNRLSSSLAGDEHGSEPAQPSHATEDPADAATKHHVTFAPAEDLAPSAADVTSMEDAAASSGRHDGTEVAPAAAAAAAVSPTKEQALLSQCLQGR